MSASTSIPESTDVVALIVDQAPPLTEAAKSRLAALLRPASASHGGVAA